MNDLSVCIQDPAFSSSYSGSSKKLNLPYTSDPIISNQIHDYIASNPCLQPQLAET